LHEASPERTSPGRISLASFFPLKEAQEFTPRRSASELAISEAGSLTNVARLVDPDGIRAAVLTALTQN
jgi:hypothetical protein